MDALAQLNAALSGHYTVEREIGHGGMAIVYLARDLRHNRHVALKVLNPELGAVLGVERFLSEIQVTANLQHPNLLALFDSGEAGGLLFYVMPYVEGESLRARLEREKQLPIDEALHIASSVASALDYAHRHGVIHRDLKPENILLHEGQPLVADFGIALAVTNAGGNRITQTGLSLGTPQYMSPEQATGDRAIDGRTDIYSLGAVTYEMLTGEPPHIGTTAQAIIAKVLTDRPRSIRLARETVPERVEAAVARALAKLPADRYNTAREFADALTGKGALPMEDAGSSRAIAHEATNGSQHSRYWPLLLPWAIAVASIAFAVTRTRAPGDANEPTLRYEIVLPARVTVSTSPGSPVAIAPGGGLVAYVGIGGNGARKLYLKSSDDLHSREVPGSEFAQNPFFSPDGDWIAFWAGGQLKKAAVAGGSAVRLTDLPTSSRASWSPSGLIVVSDGDHLGTVPAAGGTVTRLSTPRAAQNETRQAMPVALADGRTVLYQSLAMGGPAAARIGIASLQDGTTRISDVQGMYPLGMVDGNLIYTTANGTITAVPFDLRSGRSTGTPVPFDRVASETGNGQSFAELARDGTLVYLSGASQRRLVAVGSAGVARSILAEPADYAWPRLSPSGNRLAITTRSSARSDVSVYELPDGPMVRLTVDGTVNDRPEWTPDGRSILFRSNRGGQNALWMQPVDGGTPATLVLGAKYARIDEGVISPDGRWLLYQRDSIGRGEVWYRSLHGDTISRRVGTNANADVGARFSPDGKWIVSSSSESGGPQIYVRPFPSLSARYQISLDGGSTPLWSADGKRIYYRVGNQLIAAEVKATESFAVTSRTPVLGADVAVSLDVVHADYDVFKDGRVLALQAVDQSAPLVVAHNWSAELRARMRGRNR